MPRGYLTPQNEPDTGFVCVRLFIPDGDDEWFALAMGALSELGYEFNWQKAGMEIDDTVALWRAANVQTFELVDC